MELRRPEVVRVRLVRKFAQQLNGVDLSDVRVGDSLEVPPMAARMLIAEGWAELEDPPDVDDLGYH
jgi:hypothetical protein